MTKTTYAVAPGVAFVNGARVPEGGVVSLTPAEARFDLGLGRIYVSKRKKRQSSVPSDKEHMKPIPGKDMHGGGDGGD
ncbi:hypothetical protein [Roseibium algae]|uniref:Uncharacterized protein n=1 Tax=Roseibium algae TaxID=3123038 RepID=A0ABU8TJW8_9HYPH